MSALSTQDGPSGVECPVQYERGARDRRLYRFRENVVCEKLLRLMNKCRENADKEPFYTKPEVPSTAHVGGLWFPLRVTGGGEIFLNLNNNVGMTSGSSSSLFGTNRIGDSIKVCDLFVRT